MFDEAELLLKDALENRLNLLDDFGKTEKTSKMDLRYATACTMKLAMLCQDQVCPEK